MYETCSGWTGPRASAKQALAATIIIIHLVGSGWAPRSTGTRHGSRWHSTPNTHRPPPLSWAANPLPPSQLRFTPCEGAGRRPLGRGCWGCGPSLNEGPVVGPREGLAASPLGAGQRDPSGLSSRRLSLPALSHRLALSCQAHALFGPCLPPGDTSWP